MVWRIEFRKHLPLFLSVYAATAMTGTLAILQPDVLMFDVVRAMCGLLTWSATVIYSASVITRFITLGGDLLLQIAAIGRWRLVWMKAVVLATLMVVHHLLSVGLQVLTFTDAAGPDSIAVLTYVIAAKLVSIGTFLALVVLVATLAKTAGGRDLAMSMFTVLTVLFVVLQTITLWQVGAPDAQFFAIGVGGDFATVNLYANVLPIILTTPDEGILPPIAGQSVALNLAACALFVLLWSVLARLRRFDFVAI